RREVRQRLGPGQRRLLPVGEVRHMTPHDDAVEAIVGLAVLAGFLEVHLDAMRAIICDARMCTRCPMVGSSPVAASALCTPCMATITSEISCSYFTGAVEVVFMSIVQAPVIGPLAPMPV